MTEEIIIDGVNVAGCEHYFVSMNTVDTCKWFGCKCNGVSTDECKYKQLQRLRQENEEPKEEIQACYNQVEDFDIIATSQCNQNVQYRKALEEIREIANAIISGKHITNDIEGHLKELSKKIINKVNEVLSC